MTKITRWWWIRHAPVVGFEGRFYGGSDVDCDTSNRVDFKKLAERLPKEAIWLTSHLERTHKTARALYDNGLLYDQRIEEPNIGEQKYGAWEGLTYAELNKEQLRAAGGSPWHKFWMTPANHKAPGDSESFLDVMARVSKVVKRITKLYSGRDIIAIGHGGVIRAALANALEIPPDKALAISVENLSTTRLDHVTGPGIGGDWRVVFVNMRP